MGYKQEDLLGERSVLFSDSYWDDARNERGKVYDLSALETSEEVVAQLETNPRLGAIFSMADSAVGDFPLGRVLSVAAGTGWLEAKLFKKRGMESLTLTEISRHRLLQTAPMVLKAYRVPESKVRLVLSDFDSIPNLEGEFETILLSQALHHTESPGRLLKDLEGKLAPGGRLIVVGEHFYGGLAKFRALVGHFGKFFLNYGDYRSRNSFIPCYSALFPPDREKGDFHFSKSHYFQVFGSAGFRASRILDARHGRQGFILVRNIDDT